MGKNTANLKSKANHPPLGHSTVSSRVGGMMEIPQYVKMMTPFRYSLQNRIFSTPQNTFDFSFRSTTSHPILPNKSPKLMLFFC